MKKTSISLLALSLLLIIPNTIHTVERKSCKTIVVDYLKNGGKMILHAEDETKKLNLLKYFQDLSKLYQGEMKEKDIKKFSNTWYLQWLAMLPSDYAYLVLDFFWYKYSFDEVIDKIMNNTFNLSREFSKMLQGYLAWDGIKKLYELQADKKRQVNYLKGYLLILLLQGLALFDSYQADLIKCNVMQHWGPIAMATGEFVYVNLVPIFAFPHFFDVHPISVVLNLGNLILMCYNAKRNMNLFSFLQSMINLAMISYRSKRCYDVCDQKINHITRQGSTYNEVVNSLQETIQLLENHKKVALLCSEGAFFNENQGFKPSTELSSEIGAIIAEYIDPSIKPDQGILNLSTKQSKSASSFNYFQNCYCHAMTITTTTSLFLIVFAGFVFQKYFSV